jgi:hypothetical protein
MQLRYRLEKVSHSIRIVDILSGSKRIRKNNKWLEIKMKRSDQNIRDKIKRGEVKV